MSVFEKIAPYSVYVPNHDEYEVKALTDVELAVCAAPGFGRYPARLIEPDQVGIEARGYGNIERRIHNILPEQESADSLLVVEVLPQMGIGPATRLINMIGIHFRTSRCWRRPTISMFSLSRVLRFNVCIQTIAPWMRR